MHLKSHQGFIVLLSAFVLRASSHILPQSFKKHISPYMIIIKLFNYIIHMLFMLHMKVYALFCCIDKKDTRELYTPPPPHIPTYTFLCSYCFSFFFYNFKICRDNKDSSVITQSRTGRKRSKVKKDILNLNNV